MQYPPAEDDLRDSARQDTLSDFREKIIDMIKNGEEGDVIDNVVCDIPAFDFGRYLNMMLEDQSLPFNSPRLTMVSVSDVDDLAMLYDTLDIVPSDGMLSGISLYVLESLDFAITVIPVDLGENTTNIFMQPLEDSPEYIKALWEKAINERAKHKVKGKIDIYNIPGVTKGFVDKSGKKR